MADINQEIQEEIRALREEVANISAKVDQVLQTLSDFTMMLMEDPEDEQDQQDEKYDYDNNWFLNEDDGYE